MLSSYSPQYVLRVLRVFFGYFLGIFWVQNDTIGKLKGGEWD